jgi:large subunit ribosomal protein L22
MESTSYFKNVKVTPKKLRFFMPQLKKLSPVKAMELLAYTTKKPARIFYKAIHSAVANAKQTLKVNDDLLQFKTLSVDEGHVLKRYNPGSRGSAKPYKKRFSHIKIVLQVAPQSKKVTAPKEVTPVKPVKKPAKLQVAKPKKTVKGK